MTMTVEDVSRLARDFDSWYRRHPERFPSPEKHLAWLRRNVPHADHMTADELFVVGRFALCLSHDFSPDRVGHLRRCLAGRGCDLVAGLRG
jgi:hypothetical protein